MSDSDEIPQKRSKEEPRTRRLKKIKFNKKLFIDDAAESGDEEESEGDSDYAGEYEEALKLQSELPKRRALYENLTAEELAEKYERQVAYQQVNLANQEISVVSKQQELPSINDPKLWQVFCKPGKARELAINLMAKCVKCKQSPVFSAFASSYVTDCVYLEAYTKHDVLITIKGMSLINERKIIVVPIGEMVDVFNMDLTPKCKVTKGEFVRVGFGTYKDDLAQIVNVEDHLGKVTVRLVPRIETTGNKKIRPPPKLFNPSDYPNCDKKRDMNTQEIYFSYGGNTFWNGFLYKTLSLRSLKFQDIKPTLREIKIFDDNKVVMILKPKQVSFAQGDKVKVVFGDSRGLTGSVESSDNNVVNIYPFIEELCDKKFEFPIKDLCKFFDIGDHVKVIEGRYIGITGMVVSCKDNTVDFIADINRTILTVLANDLKLSEEISSGQDRSENYNINEIILLKNDLNFGIVTKINSGGVTTVLDNNETSSIWYHEISKKYSPYRFTALDRDQNKLCYNDMVKIVFPKHPFSNRFGSVKNAFRGTVFLQIQEALEGKIVAVKASFCLLQGKNSEQEVLYKDDHLGVIVRLKTGPYRGATAKVVDVYESKFKVELFTISKILTIDASACEKVEASNDVMAIQDLKKTPAANSPAYTPHEIASPWETPRSRAY